jgi:hypothetical protein
VCTVGVVAHGGGVWALAAARLAGALLLVGGVERWRLGRGRRVLLATTRAGTIVVAAAVAVAVVAVAVAG